MIDRGTGPAVVVIPGLQGRWEWHAPGIDALARRCRVITYSLSGEPGAPELPALESRALESPAFRRRWKLRRTAVALAEAVRPAPEGIDSLTSQLGAVLDRAGVERAVVCGVSFGGIVALHFAATRPERTAGLALVSTPGPRWRADARIRRHVRWPRLLAPWFVATSPLRVTPEVLAACPGQDRIRVVRGLPRAAAFMVRHGVRVMAAPMAPTRMAARVEALMSTDTPADCARVAAPTLVVTGEPSLDRVVPVEGSREYVRTIRNARHVVLERTGHIGLVTKPSEFAEVIGQFARECLGENRNRTDAEAQRRAEDDSEGVPCRP